MLLQAQKEWTSTYTMYVHGTHVARRSSLTFTFFSLQGNILTTKNLTWNINAVTMIPYFTRVALSHYIKFYMFRQSAGTMKSFLLNALDLGRLTFTQSRKAGKLSPLSTWPSVSSRIFYHIELCMDCGHYRCQKQMLRQTPRNLSCLTVFEHT